MPFAGKFSRGPHVQEREYAPKAATLLSGSRKGAVGT